MSATRGHDEDDQQEQEARARIRSTQHRRSVPSAPEGRWVRPARSGRRRSRACGSRAHGRVDSGRSAGPARATRAGRGRPAGGRCHSWSPDWRTTCASQKKASRKVITITPRTSPRWSLRRPARTAVRMRRRPEGRTLRERGGRRAGQRRWFVGGRPRRRPSSISSREAQARAARVEEGQRVGRRGRTPVVQLELEALVMLLPIAAVRGPRAAADRTTCDDSTDGACSPGLLLPWLVAARPSDRLTLRRPADLRPRGARRPAGGRSGRVGWRRSRPPTASATAG